MAHHGRGRGNTRQKGMIFPEVENRSILEACRKKLIDEPAAMALDSGLHPEPMSVRTMDFDGAVFIMKIPDFANAPTVMELTFEWSCLKTLMECGAQAMLDDVYKAYNPQYDGSKTVTLTFDAANPPEEAEATCMKVARFKRNLFGAPLEQYFDAAGAGDELPATVINYRKDGVMYIQSGSDRCTVVHQISFEDPTDSALSYVFMNEFADVQKRQACGPHVQMHPKSQDEWTVPPAVEAVCGEKGTSVPTSDNLQHMHFLSFAVTKRDFNSAAKKAKCIDLLLSTRLYVHYHIKCTKAYLHQRMRAKVKTLLKVLNQAYPQDKSGKVKKRNL